MQSLPNPRALSLHLTLVAAVAIATVPAWAQSAPPLAAPILPSGPQSGSQLGPPSGPQPGTAAPEVDPKLLAQRSAYDAAFQQTLDKPSDPAVLVKFAKIAVAMGDVEGAISALERLLLLEGDQPEVKLELGVLYYRLGATDVAHAYLEQARDSQSATDDVRQRANTYLSAELKR